MKIGFSTAFNERSLNRGIVDGIGHYTKQVYEGVVTRGHEALPYAFPPPVRRSKIERSIPFPRSYALQLSGSKFGIFRPLKMPVDIFHVTDFRSVAMDVPIVSTIWDVIPFARPEWARSLLRRYLTPLVLKESSKHIDRVVCASEHAAKDVERFYEIPSEKICIIPCSISDHWKSVIGEDKRQRALAKFHIDHDYILTVGTLQPRKNIERLIDAFLEIPDRSGTRGLKLVIVGKTGWACGDVIRKIRANSTRVIHLGNVDSDEDLRAIYQSARVVAFPSLYEGFGLPALEAFASRVPLVASSFTSIPEVTGDAAILVDPLSTESISRGLMDVLLDGSVASDLVNRGSARLQRFGSDKMIDDLIALYSTLL